MYDRFRQRWFDFMDSQHQMTNQLQKLNDNNRFLHLNYLHESVQDIDLMNNFNDFGHNILNKIYL